MIEETAVVTRCLGELAEVQTQRTSACSSCSAKSGCGTATLSQLAGGGGGIAVMTARNPLGARPGEQVVIGLEEGALARAAVAAYLAPVAALILSAALGQGLAERMGWATEPGAILGGLLGLAMALAWLRGFGQRFSRDRRHQAVILRRAGEVPVRFIPLHDQDAFD